MCSPGIVRYELQNAVAGSSYEWNVGLGNTTGADTLFAFYTGAMVVNASVKITLPNGTVCTVTADSIVTVRDIPEPQFLASRYKLCNGPDLVTFYDITPNSANRNWIIDGTNYNQTADSVVHQFVTSGFKKVSLVVVDSFGCEGVAQFADTIKIYPDLAFDYEASNVSGCAPKSVDFTLTNNPSSPYQKTFSWSFPGSSSVSDSGPNPSSRVYSSSGNYTTSLRVDLSIGCSYFIQKDSLINLGDSFPLNFKVTDAIACGDAPVIVELLNDSLPGRPDWVFIGIDHTVKSKSSRYKEITILDSGVLSMYITHSHNGCISKRTISRNMFRMNVKADFWSDDNFHCDIPHTVHLWNNSDTMDADSLSYVWNVYNGDSLVHSSTNEHDSLTFNELPAFHTVELIATGNNGCSDTIKITDFIYQDSLFIKFVPMPAIACVGQPILFNNSTRPSSYLSPDEFIWTFYDKDDSTILDTSHEISPYMVYYDTGFYDIYVTAKNGIGCKDTLLKEDRVQIIEPVLDYTVVNPTICRGDSFLLTANTGPDFVNFTHRWTLISQISDSTYEFEGDSVFAYIDDAGPIQLIYECSILDGCIRRDTSFIYINELQLEIGFNSLQECSPFNLEPEVNIISNFHYPFLDSSITYNWYVTPSSGETIDPIDSIKPSITLYNDGYYQIGLDAINSSSCISQSLSDSLQVGVSSEFSLKRDKICLGDTLKMQIENYRSGTDANFYLSQSNDFTLVQYDSINYGLYVSDSGNYELNLVIARDSSCYDTSALSFEVIKVIADFNSSDTFLQCAPVYVQFMSQSINADSLFWDFGDGTSNTTTSRSAGTIYEKNTGSTDGYDIQLIAKNKVGCYDTAFKLDYVIVKGPIPKFSLENFKGCEPLEVQFLDSSIDVSRFYLNYNDGSELDSTSISTHTYYNTSNNLIKKVRPSIFVYDSLGCGAVYNSPQMVTIYKKPKAGFILEYDSSQCRPIKTVFTDTGQYAIGTQWNINGTEYSSSVKDSALLFESGYNNIELITTNLHYCSDTSSKDVFVSGFPEIALNIHDTLCLLKEVDFSVNIELDENTDTTAMELNWDFGESGSPGNTASGIENKTFTYLQGGAKQIILAVKLANNCIDSFIQDIVILTEADIDTPQLLYVSFDNNYELRIVHESTDYVRFKEYEINNSAGKLFNAYNSTDTVHFDYFSAKPAASECYSLSVNDICDLEGFSAVEHCYIYLDIQSIVPFENLLNWTHYQGWPSVDKYRIYRKSENESEYSQLAEIDGSFNEYRDTNLCLLNYEYYVQAVHPNQAYYSNSFSVNQTPLYADNPLLSSIKNVSVSDRNELTIKWNKSAHKRWNYYLLDKYETDESNFLERFELVDTFYIDNDVNTSEYSYIYKLREVDICGEINEADREGKSILLKGYYDIGSHLNWTFYRNWENGVEYYDLELLNNGNISILSTLNSNTNTYLDASWHAEVFGQYCYIVYGLNDISDTSYSNIVCVNGDPIVHIPNAFSPNADGHNEVFRPITTFVVDGTVTGVENYLFTVYNRWGEKVFETFDIREGWDGYYKGELCQQDVYIYRLRCEGVDGNQYNFDGTVTLVR